MLRQDYAPEPGRSSRQISLPCMIRTWPSFASIVCAVELPVARDLLQDGRVIPQHAHCLAVLHEEIEGYIADLRRRILIAKRRARELQHDFPLAGARGDEIEMGFGAG